MKFRFDRTRNETHKENPFPTMKEREKASVGMSVCALAKWPE
jgi:hypothetical protein